MAEIVMNPVRQRIFQYFLLHKTGTVKEIRKALPDVPSASLYRHIKILTDSTILMVVGENRIRGTVESVYQLNKDAMETEDETGNAVQMSLLSICATFAKYFSSGKADPKKDMLLFTNCTLLLTDEEFSGFLTEINQIAVKYMKKEAVEGSKTRQITLISAPSNEEVMIMEKQGQWLLCPYCHGKTRVWLRGDTVLRNYLLFCPKCKQETLIDLRQFHITLLNQPDAKTQS